MSQTDEELKEIAKIPDNAIVKDVLQNLLFGLLIKKTLTPDNVRNIIGK